MKTRFCLSLSVVAALWMTACSPESHSPPHHVADSNSQIRRAVFRFSVVPGGVYSDEELGRIRGLDRVVAEHYAPIGFHAVAMSLPRQTNMYASYRIQNKIYWTARKLRIPQGEHVLSDGTNLVRTRCGNRLSSVPMTPTQGREEPSASAFDDLEAPLDADAIHPTLLNVNYSLEPGPIPFNGDVFASNFSGSPLLILPTNFNLRTGASSTNTGNIDTFPNVALLRTFGGGGIGPEIPPAALVSIPEPEAWAIFLTGMLLLSSLRKKPA
ncbi:MAG: hypothetical protein M3Y57_14865 [Acidobacteriota bacterium]|nr:hypothetical protein [Acidobacteriota bacterium]